MRDIMLGILAILLSWLVKLYENLNTVTACGYNQRAVLPATGVPTKIFVVLCTVVKIGYHCAHIALGLHESGTGGLGGTL